MRFRKRNSVIQDYPKIVLDDSDRTDEQEIINRWILENPEFYASQLKTEKGMSVLKQKI